MKDGFARKGGVAGTFESNAGNLRGVDDGRGCGAAAERGIRADADGRTSEPCEEQDDEGSDATHGRRIAIVAKSALRRA